MWLDDALVAGAEAWTVFNFVNSCNFPVWVGLQPNGGIPLLANGGFQVLQGAQQAVTAPAGWGGRFWGRTGDCMYAIYLVCSVWRIGTWRLLFAGIVLCLGWCCGLCVHLEVTGAFGVWGSGCVFDSTGMGTCDTGDCGGVLQCNGAGGNPPASLAEITLDGANGYDFYDISLVDGYNLPINMQPIGGTSANGTCGAPGCISNLNLNCPTALQVPYPANSQLPTQLTELLPPFTSLITTTSTPIPSKQLSGPLVILLLASHSDLASHAPIFCGGEVDEQ